jgi:hypothetical protein
MNAPGRLALYGAGLVVVFFAAFGLAGVLVTDDNVDSWMEQVERIGHGDDHGSAADDAREEGRP